MTMQLMMHSPVKVECNHNLGETWVLRIYDDSQNNIVIFTTQAVAEAMTRAFQEAKE